MKALLVLALLPLASHGADFATELNRTLELARSGELEPALERSSRLLEPNAFTRLRGTLAARTGGVSEAAFEWLDAPLAWCGLETRTAHDRAAVQLLRGVLFARSEQPDEALAALDEARLLAGPGGVRLDAIYDLGTLALRAGEASRALVPELSGMPPGSPGPPPSPMSTGLPGSSAGVGGSDQAPDPLAAAREAYLRARAHFVERLREDWEDGDTRANVELTLRRLRELDAIERQREQKKDDSEQQQQQDGDESQQDSQGQPEDQEGEQQNESQEESPSEGSESESEQEQPEPSEEESEQPSEGESSEERPSEDEAAREGEPEERELTREEVQRLLQRLSEHEQEGEEVRARMRRYRRVPVERDW